ncbi:hypothetical protein SKAU_G00067550 [Synaphobranchus kaupii]|uniref:PiggyBac transposable element-derived protein domain-containing protein n=1 Tax=Synaphobranchus kaupii TaxID=118154 RepID=A0A9Q1G7P5_SYNKA|nr:hypothetical protein SKAU_G00067550 [Synaphobranchus kaupii]
MSNLYSTQTKDKQLNLSMDELLTFYGILITCGYSSVPRRHLHWSVDSDVHNESISDAMRRNRFDEIMASVHVVDNTKITDDPFFKGPSVVLGLAEQAQVPQDCKFIHDNLFTSLALLDEMTKRGYGSSGTVSRYHISIRSKKWWWPIFAWSLNSALVNSHCFYRDVMGGTIDLLTFSRIVAQSLMQRFGTKPLSHRRRSLLAATVEDQARYDKASHWPINTMHRFQRCRRCDKRTTYACEKCKAPLHIACFKIYHGQ